MESSSSRPDANACYASASGPLAACEGALAAHSFAIPCNRDFHFYNSFDPFRCYSNRIFSNSQSLLSHLSVADRQPPPPEDLDDAFSWLVDYNDKLLEQFSSSLECFDEERSRLERGFRREGTVEDERFELVTHGKTNGGKKKQRAGSGEEGRTTSHLAARVMVRDKKTGEWSARVPFHIPGIARPQDQFNILVNNANQPFDHVWLDTTDDGTRFIHPLEKISFLDFVDGTVAKHEPVKSQSLQDTPFKLVDGVNELKELAMKLRNATEFAVDLEHNQYRSFLGLTCLMQISTRMEDFVVDTLKLRIHIGPYLREIFKDPSKKKIMHGADRDILWLQRDFGIYICNLFDTGQASRILKLERHSLEYLLHHYCGVTLNKEYQNADWRLRPIPDEMIKYAREDTHYLLYLYDLMRHDLLASTYAENGGALIEAYKRSYDVCMQLYEKELLTDTSYLYIYGLREADLNCEQLATAAALYEWRDGVARAEDESTGFVLPNKALLEVARQLPRTRGKLRQLLGSRHPFVERQLDLVVSIIKCAVINAPAFAGVLQQLEEERLEAESKKLDAGFNETNREASRLGDAAFINTEEKVQSLPDSSGDGMTTGVNTASVQALKKPSGAFGALLGSSSSRQRPDLSSSKSSELDNTASVQALKKPSAAFGALLGNSSSRQRPDLSSSKSSELDNTASVQALKKPSGAFGALLGSSSSRQRPDASSSKSSEREVAQIKLEQIKSSVHLPLFSIPDVTVERPKERLESPQYQHAEIQQESDVQPDFAVCEEIIPLGGESDDSHQSMEIPESRNSPKDSTTHKMDNLERTKNIEPVSDKEGKIGSPSLAELSSGLEKCFNSLSQSAEKIKPWSPQGPLKVEPYDYATAKKRFDSGGNRDAEEGSSHKSSRGGRRERKGPACGPSGEASETGFQAARRRQAFPPSGNRNATFR